MTMKYPELKLKADFKKRLEKAEAPKKERVKKTVEKVKAQLETIDEAWVRILSMKNSEADKEKLYKVKLQMEAGLLGREPESMSKKFSKAEALRLYKVIEDAERGAKLEQMVKETPDNYILVEDDNTLSLLLEQMDSHDMLAVDCETYADEDVEGSSALDPWTGHMAGFTVSTREYHFYIPTQHIEETKLIKERGEKYIMSRIRPRLEDSSKKLILHNAPFDAKWFYVYHNIDFIDNIYADTRILAFMMDENRSHALKELATDWLKMKSDKFSSLFKEGEFNKVPLRYAKAYGSKDGDLTLQVYDFCEYWLNKREDLKKIRELVYDVEMPVLRQMIKSDLRGITFDANEAVEVDAKLEAQEKEIENEIHGMLGEAINVGSPAQLSKKLFNEMGITDLKDGSTSSKVLKKIKSEHPVIPLILKYREVSKLRNSFTVKLPKEIKRDGKIHPWHNSLGAKTGRKTCSNPNSQQLPSMTKNPLIRPLFKPSKGHIFCSIDFSQIELRCLAAVSGEEIMIRAFMEGKDLHSTTAATVFLPHLPFDEGYEQIEKYKDMDDRPEAKYRKQSKNVNFGAVYGIQGKGLSEMLGNTEKEANKILDGYFEGYPGIKDYMAAQVAFLHKHGYVVDYFGRKRRLKSELNSGQWWKISGAERQAGNFGIQSMAGIILKMAIVALQPVLEDIGGHILLSIHDELLFELPETVTKEEVYRLKDTMENVVKLVVPLRSDVELNPDAWGVKVSEEEFFGSVA